MIRRYDGEIRPRRTCVWSGSKQILKVLSSWTTGAALTISIEGCSIWVKTACSQISSRSSVGRLEKRLNSVGRLVSVPGVGCDSEYDLGVALISMVFREARYLNVLFLEPM